MGQGDGVRSVPTTIPLSSNQWVVSLLGFIGTLGSLHVPRDCIVLDDHAIGLKNPH